MPGDPWLKADVQLLADAGVISSPISSWPLSWGDISQDLNRWKDDNDLTAAELLALQRMRTLAMEASAIGELRVSSSLIVSEKARTVRSFYDAPRGEQELRLDSSWTGERVALGVSGRYVNNDSLDGDEWRLDGSYASLALGNWIVGASAIDRWWGPGWNGSLILSNNARPIPSLVIERNFSTPFAHSWLRWLGPWSTSVVWGQMESTRAVPNTRFFGWRVNFKPTTSLEFGLLRTAQWCGDGRACDLDAFAKVLIGDTNLGADGAADVANQLAGVDIRWASPVGEWPYAVYGQFIGEDEAGGFPSRFMGQMGIEAWGYLSRGTSWRVFAEYADTVCQFYESSRIEDCAYNNTFYPTGYRYRGRSIGYPTDNDAQTVAMALVVSDVQHHEWSLEIRKMKLNRIGQTDTRNVVTSVPLEISDIEVRHRRSIGAMSFTAGVGAERRGRTVLESSKTDLSAFLRLDFSL